MLVDFFDSEYLSQQYSDQDDKYIVCLTLWNNKPAKIVFDGVIGVCAFSNTCPIGLRYEASPSHFFQDALTSAFEKIPEQHGYMCYEIIDVNEEPFIKVVAKGYEFLE
ncbi:MAG: hypothetical protein FWE95_00735 [Planctomycetaceae bacterium]|nr:hypothetical protein [Planctomycetaceae bacterium]